MNRFHCDEKIRPLIHKRTTQGRTREGISLDTGHIRSSLVMWESKILLWRDVGVEATRLEQSTPARLPKNQREETVESADIDALQESATSTADSFQKTCSRHPGSSSSVLYEQRKRHGPHQKSRQRDRNRSYITSRDRVCCVYIRVWADPARRNSSSCVSRDESLSFVSGPDSEGSSPRIGHPETICAGCVDTATDGSRTIAGYETDGTRSRRGVFSRRNPIARLHFVLSHSSVYLRQPSAPSCDGSEIRNALVVETWEGM